MTRYYIRISYQTGDSFKSYSTEDELGVSWTSLARAKEALARIRAHYELYLRRNSRWSPDTLTDEQWLAAVRALPGCDPQFPDVCIQVLLDSGEPHRVYTFWQGYFERLHSAEIFAVPEENSSMRYVPGDH